MHSLGHSRRVSSYAARSAPGLALALAMAALLAACASVPRVPPVVEAPGTPGSEIAIFAADLVGTPYRFGGADARGFDCSGLAVYAYEKVGIAIPRTAAEQEHTARPVPLRDLLPGDLVFFRIRSRHVNHVGIYVGGGQFIHAPRPDSFVMYASLNQRFYRRHFVRAGRFWQ
jgi:murein DD-endopeptidase